MEIRSVQVNQDKAEFSPGSVGWNQEAKLSLDGDLFFDASQITPIDLSIFSRHPCLFVIIFKTFHNGL